MNHVVTKEAVEQLELRQEHLLNELDSLNDRLELALQSLANPSDGGSMDAGDA